MYRIESIASEVDIGEKKLWCRRKMCHFTNVTIFILMFTLSIIHTHATSNATTNTEKRLSRKRRYLIFPDSSSFQLGNVIFFTSSLRWLREVFNSILFWFRCLLHLPPAGSSYMGTYSVRFNDYNPRLYVVCDNRRNMCISVGLTNDSTNRQWILRQRRWSATWYKWSTR